MGLPAGWVTDPEIGLTRSQQLKALGKLFDAGPDGIAGGMSTETYVHLTGVSRATAYRELTDLTERDALLAWSHAMSRVLHRMSPTRADKNTP